MPKWKKFNAFLKFINICLIHVLNYIFCDNRKILKISNFIYNVKFYLLHQVFFVRISNFTYLRHEIFFIISNFIFYIKKYLISDIFCINNFFMLYVFVLSTFLIWNENLFKEFSFIALVLHMVTTSKLTEHVLKTLTKNHYKKHGGLQGLSYSFLITTAYWIRGCEAICSFNQWS